MKLHFESEGWTQTTLRKTGGAVCDKVSRRFKVLVRLDERLFKANQVALVIAMISGSHSAVLNRFDEIAEFCESTDFGRVLEEEVVVDDLDAWLSDDSGGNDDER